MSCGLSFPLCPKCEAPIGLWVRGGGATLGDYFTFSENGRDVGEGGHGTG